MALSSERPRAQPGHRRRLGEEERRRQLIAATVSLLSRRGYQNTSLAAIASEAGVSKGLLWHYFADGDELMEQTALTTLARLCDTVAGDIDLSLELPRIIRAAIRRAAGLLESHRAELGAVREIVQNLRHPDGSLRFGLTELYEETYTLQAALFGRGQREGTLRGDLDLRCVVVTYQGAIDAMLGYLEGHPEVDADAYAGTVADVLLGGIATGSGHLTRVDPSDPGSVS